MEVNKVEPAVHACRTRTCLKTETGTQLFGYCIVMTETLWVPPTTQVIYLWTYNLFKHLVSCLIGPATLQCLWQLDIFLGKKVWHQMGRLMNNFLVMKQGADTWSVALTDEGGRQTDRSHAAGQRCAALPAYCGHFQWGQVRRLALSSELLIPHIPENTLLTFWTPTFTGWFLICEVPMMFLFSPQRQTHIQSIIKLDFTRCSH